MQSSPRRYEIDHHTIKLIVGVIALSLALLTSLFAGPIESISDSYHEHDWSRNILVGFLFAIAAFLLAYNGYKTHEMVLSRVASVAALAIALFPCQCERDDVEVVPYVHGTAAAIMFVVLAFFCYSFFRRASAKGHSRAKLRAGIYAVCGGIIVLSIGAVALDRLTDWNMEVGIKNLTFWGEAFALSAFGVAWLVASRTLPVVTRPDERVPILKAGGGGADRGGE